MSEKKQTYKVLNSEIKELEKINQIISDQKSKMVRIHEFLSIITEIYISYLKFSKEFSNKIENLAMKLKPDSRTFEGRIVQVFQNILLFNSNLLNKMVKDLNIFYQQESKNNDDINDLNDFASFKDIYSKQYQKTLDSYKMYQNGLVNLEDYLIQKELGNIKEEDSTDKKIKNVCYNQEKFISNIKNSNGLLKNMFNYFSMEKNKMRTQMFNYCNKFNDNLINYINKQNETCLNQKSILDDLTKNFNLKEIEIKEFADEYLTINPYPLKCLTTAEEKEEIYNLDEKIKLNLGQALNIMQIFDSNGLIILNKGNTMKIKEEELTDKDKIIIYLKDIFDPKHSSNNEIDNQEMLLILRDKLNQDYFLKLLNDYRMKGKYQIGKDSLSDLGFLFQYLNEYLTKKLDTKLFTQLFIMAFTFYYQEKVKGSDIVINNYLYKYIWNCEIYKDCKFWEKYLEELIEIDKKSTPPDELDLNFLQFVQTMTVVQDMTLLHLNSDFISDFMEYIFEKYKLKDDQKVQVNNLFEISLRTNSLSKNDRSTLSTELNKSLHNSSDNKKFFSENRLSNGSNNNSDKGNLFDDEQYESDGSGESIELEPMKKKIK